MGDLAEHIKSCVKAVVFDYKGLKSRLIHLLLQGDIKKLIRSDESRDGCGDSAKFWLDFLIEKLKEENMVEESMNIE